jgi:hypothetical protein
VDKCAQLPKDFTSCSWGAACVCITVVASRSMLGNVLQSTFKWYEPKQCFTGTALNSSQQYHQPLWKEPCISPPRRDNSMSICNSRREYYQSSSLISAGHIPCAGILSAPTSPEAYLAILLQILSYFNFSSSVWARMIF